jgi:hypothetical protein
MNPLKRSLTQCGNYKLIRKDSNWRVGTSAQFNSLVIGIEESLSNENHSVSDYCNDKRNSERN